MAWADPIESTQASAAAAMRDISSSLCDVNARCRMAEHGSRRRLSVSFGAAQNRTRRVEARSAPVVSTQVLMRLYSRDCKKNRRGSMSPDECSSHVDGCGREKQLNS